MYLLYTGNGATAALMQLVTCKVTNVLREIHKTEFVDWKCKVADDGNTQVKYKILF